jgi:arylsulfatase A-like enzyme
MWGRILDSRWFYIVAASLVILFYLSTRIETEQRVDSRPTGSSEDISKLSERDDLNVLFILIDTLRADRLGTYGYERDTSPTIDYLAQTGVRFAHHLSQSSWTKCSMASLWTGLYPVRTGVLRSQHAISSEAQMPAEIFREAGLRTAGIWRNGWVAPNFGFAQGFELYYRPQPSKVPATARRENPWVQIEGTDTDILDSVKEFLSSYGRERWFLYVHLMDVHQYVYDEETALFGTQMTDNYDNSIRRIDKLVALLLGNLDKRGLLEKTLVVLSSDHGEAFGEHGREGHARDVHGEVTEVPLILAFPFRLEPGIVVNTRSQNVDVWPTVLELMGLPPLQGIDGRSLVAEIEAGARGESLDYGSRLAFAQIDQTWGQREGQQPAPMVAVTEGSHRLIFPARNPEKLMLFDRDSDVREQRNIAEEETETAARLREQAEAYLASPPPPWGDETPSVELDDMDLNQLRALGYVLP